MTIQITDYSKFKSDFLRNVRCSNEELIKLKKTFEKQIKSRRAVSYISNLEELLDILEIRSILSEENTGCLAEILTVLGRSTSLLNLLLNCQISKDIKTITTPVKSNTRILNYGQTQRDQIYDLLSTEIGHTWKHFARHMHIGEGTIDQLEDKYHYNPAERVRDMLQYYEAKHSDNWYPLLEALTKSRRSDLRIKVQNILSNTN